MTFVRAFEDALGFFSEESNGRRVYGTVSPAQETVPYTPGSTPRAPRAHLQGTAAAIYYWDVDQWEAAWRKQQKR
jgi:hypothetical protein